MSDDLFSVREQQRLRAVAAHLGVEPSDVVRTGVLFLLDQYTPKDDTAEWRGLLDTADPHARGLFKSLPAELRADIKRGARRGNRYDFWLQYPQDDGDVGVIRFRVRRPDGHVHVFELKVRRDGARWCMSRE